MLLVYDVAENRRKMPPAEVAKDGVVRIPKAVFETAPAAAAGSSSDPPAGGKVTQVKRLDGTIQEVVTGVPPNNPNFVPRKCWPGGKIVTNDKLEVQLRFYERKGMPLTPELEAKKAELEAAGNAEAEAKVKRAAKFGVPGKGGKGAKGASSSSDSAAAGKAKAAAAAAIAAAPKVDEEQKQWYKSRPKGGVKVLGGVEGALGKRTADAAAEGEPPQKQAA